MITVRFFANLRETLGQDNETLAPAPDTVRDVAEALAREHGEEWRAALLEGRVLVAVNRTMADFDSVVADGDEVAFFPPVTGG